MISLNQLATWVLSLNSNECRIYKLSTKAYQLTLLKETLHPASKLRDIELTSDKAGDLAREAFTQPSDPKKIQVDDFSRQVAKELNKVQDYLIGFVVSALNTPEWKEGLGISAEMTAMVPIIVGWPADKAAPSPRPSNTYLEII